jgi:rfaE bifunctional protein nucleotidyltransferase chain/domain
MQFDQVVALCQVARQRRQKIVLVTGVFDLLHEEHKKFLRQAQQLGDLLIIGVESDVRVTRLKGAGRPINTAATRLSQLESLQISQAIFELPAQFDDLADYRQLLQQLHPDILAVSSHTNFQEVKEQLMAEIGGKVVIAHQHNPAISTTILLKQQG